MTLEVCDLVSVQPSEQTVDGTETSPPPENLLVEGGAHPLDVHSRFRKLGVSSRSDSRTAFSMQEHVEWWDGPHVSVVDESSPGR